MNARHGTINDRSGEFHRRVPAVESQVTGCASMD